MLIPFTSQTLPDAALALSQGLLVSFPTETVYGLGANACDDKAVAQIYAAKGRPSFNPLIVHVASLAQAQEIGVFNKTSLALAEAFWPGALSVIVPLRPQANISSLVTAGLTTIAIRLPQSALVRELIAKAGVPIAAPSANLSGKISPTTAAHVAQDLDEACAYILDGGPCQAGLESTIVEAKDRSVTILRPGPITSDMIIDALPNISVTQAEISNDHSPSAPGQLTSHYAPKKPVRLNASTPQEGEIYIGFGPSPHKTDFNLSPSADPIEAAANLFAILHEADTMIGRQIAIAPISQDGIGYAISDRLQRAAADR